MRSVGQATDLACQHFIRHLSTYLLSHVTGREVRFEVPLKPPTLTQARGAFPQVGEWVASWIRAGEGPWEVDFVRRRWSGVGEQEVPHRALIRGANTVAEVAGKEELWARALSFYEAARVLFDGVACMVRGTGVTHGVSQLSKQDVVATAEVEGVGPFELWRESCQGQERWPEEHAGLAAWAAKSTKIQDESHWVRALKVAAWAVEHPNSGMRLRSVPVAGIDTKWLEHHLGVVQRIVGTWREMLGLQGGHDLGLHPKEEASYTVVWADPAARPANMRSATLPLTVLASLEVQCRHVWVFENLESVMAVPDLPGVIVVHGGGKRASSLAQVPWIRRHPIIYWGDVDTHGFEILANARRAGLEAVSVLMDRDTLMSHREFWGVEERPSSTIDRAQLTSEELAVLDALNVQGRQVRLEQERLSWPWVLERLTATLA